MKLEDYQTWSRGLDVDPSAHHPTDSACRLTAEGVVDIFHEPKFKLTREDEIFTIGSCFARNIEDTLIAKKYKVSAAHLDLPKPGFRGPNAKSVLTKFNTHSMLTELQLAFEGRQLPEDGLIELREGGFWNPQLHRVGIVDKALALTVRDKVADVVRRIADAGVVIVTLGLTEYWYDKEFGVPLNDTPIDWRYAMRTNRFEFRNSPFADSYEQVMRLKELIFKVSKSGNTKMIITVSPVPLQRTFSKQDVIVANTYSKSVLRAIAQEVANSDDRVDYFPSYEIVMNSPRSFAWKHDQRHVEFGVIQTIVSKFESLYFG